jgi:hypothetical protein
MLEEERQSGRFSTFCRIIKETTEALKVARHWTSKTAGGISHCWIVVIIFPEDTYSHPANAHDHFNACRKILVGQNDPKT